MSLRIKKNDKVVIISGKSRGKQGRVLRVSPSKGTAIVEGVNMVKKHIRKKSEAEAGGFQEVALPLKLSVMQLFCPKCNKGVRTGVELLKDKGKKRICKKCRKAV